MPTLGDIFDTADADLQAVVGTPIGVVSPSQRAVLVEDLDHLVNRLRDGLRLSRVRESDEKLLRRLKARANSSYDWTRRTPHSRLRAGWFRDMKRLAKPVEGQARVTDRRLTRPDLGVMAEPFDQRGRGGRVPASEPTVVPVRMVRVAGSETLAGKAREPSAQRLGGGLRVAEEFGGEACVSPALPQRGGAAHPGLEDDEPPSLGLNPQLWAAQVGWGITWPVLGGEIIMGECL